MKRGLLLIVLLSLCSSCTLLRIPKSADVPVPVEPKSVDDDAQFGPEIEEFQKQFKAGLPDRLRRISSEGGIGPISTGEVRLYQIHSFFAPPYKGFAVDNSLIILTRSGSSFSGRAIRKVIKSSSGSKDGKQLLSETLPAPKSNWPALWQMLENEGVFVNQTEFGRKVRPDTTLFVIETRTSEVTQISYFHTPKSTSTNPDEQRIARIFNLIAAEFEFSDVKAN